MHTSWHSPHLLQGFCCAFVASIESVIPLLANELKNDRALTRPGIEIDQNYLLPGSGHQLAVSKRNSQGRLQQRRAKMTGAVVVAPSCMMEIIALLGNQSLEKFMDVANKSGLEFDCGYASCRSGNKYQCLAFFQPNGRKRVSQGRGQIVDVAVPLGLNDIFGCFDHA